MFEILWFEMGWDIPSEGFCPSPAHPPHLKFVKTLWNMYAHWLRPVWLMHYVWLALLTLAIVPWTHTENNLFSNRELCDAGTWLCPIWCIQMGEYSSKKILSFPYQQIKTVGLFIPGNITILQLFLGIFGMSPPPIKGRRCNMCMHYMQLAPLTLFILFCELFSNLELFTNHELLDTCTSALSHVACFAGA